MTAPQDFIGLTANQALDIADTHGLEMTQDWDKGTTTIYLAGAIVTVEGSTVTIRDLGRELIDEIIEDRDATTHGQVLAALHDGEYLASIGADDIDVVERAVGILAEWRCEPALEAQTAHGRVATCTACGGQA